MGMIRFRAPFGGDGQIALSRYITVLLIRLGNFFSRLDFENPVMLDAEQSVKKSQVLYQHLFFPH